ncbi:MAG: Transposase for insertion sequence element IS231A [Magnetococcales bacterium]|nr:Transposase for insertion sequence element IS231A [Magnetococcales bacterium]HIJ85263.1 hypothetical protein [Magnetococcales bacterium]
MADVHFIASHRQSPEDFTRCRILTFGRLVMLLLNQLNGSLQDELDRFFRVLNPFHWLRRVVTAAALSRAC